MAVALVGVGVGVWSVLAWAEVAGPARVVDGDTIEVADERVRLYGIDAPELDQPCERAGEAYACGVAATRWLEAEIDGNVRCEEVTRDRYGRMVAICFVGETNLNQGMVDAGWALAYRRFTRQFIDDELAAIAARRGLWAGRFTPPWQWRRGEVAMVDAGSANFQTALATQLELAGGDAAGDQTPIEQTCPIKGNVNSSGGQVYHVPGGSHYARLRLDPIEGDRCFATEADAQASGFRPAKR